MPKFFLSIASISHLGSVPKPLATQRNVNNVDAVSTVSGEKTKAVKDYTESFELYASNNYTSRKY
jgi:hypothetical protein